MKVKEKFFIRGSFVIGHGLETRFWEHTWLGDKPPAQHCPSLYNIMQQKQVLVANVLSQTPLNITFLRTFLKNRWRLWLQLV
jgi:hypothetical protein